MVTLKRALVFGIAAFVGASLAGMLVEESGYSCLSGEGSVYRMLPPGQTERVFLIGHIMLYPAATLIGRMAGKAWFGSDPRPGWLGTLVRAPLVTIVGAPLVAIGALFMQLPLSNALMHVDACGAGNHRYPDPVGFGCPVIAMTVMAIAVGLISWHTVPYNEA